MIIKEEDVLYARRIPIMNVVIIKNLFDLTDLVSTLENKIKKISDILFLDYYL
jgi:hypothetical protein